MVFLFPFAGGTSLAFSEWQFIHPARVHSLDYKGHGVRMKEALDSSFEALVLDMTTQIEALNPDEEPLILFGHSMGALVAWDAAKILLANGIRIKTLIVSSCVPPHHFDEKKYIEMDSDEWLRDFIKKYSRVMEKRMKSAFFQQKIFPAIRNDYHLISMHKHEDKFLAPFDIICLYGEGDDLMPSKKMPEWEECTSGQFVGQSFPGNHFYIEDKENRKKIITLIEEIRV